MKVKDPTKQGQGTYPFEVLKIVGQEKFVLVRHVSPVTQRSDTRRFLAYAHEVPTLKTFNSFREAEQFMPQAAPGEESVEFTFVRASQVGVE